MKRKSFIESIPLWMGTLTNIEDPPLVSAFRARLVKEAVLPPETQDAVTALLADILKERAEAATPVEPSVENEAEQGEESLPDTEEALEDGDKTEEQAEEESAAAAGQTLKESIPKYVETVMSTLHEKLSWDVTSAIDDVLIAVLTASFEAMVEQDVFDTELMLEYVSKALIEVATASDEGIKDIDIILAVMKQAFEKIAAALNAVRE